MVELTLYTNKNAVPISNLFDLFCDLASWRQLGDLAAQLYELANYIPFTAEEIGLIIEAGLDIVRDLDKYEGMRDILDNLSDYICDLSVKDEWVEKAAGFLVFARQLPDYEGFKQVLGYLQEFLASPPEAQQVREMIYQLPVFLTSLPNSSTLATYINQWAEMLPALFSQPAFLDQLQQVLDLFCDLSIQHSVTAFLQAQFCDSEGMAEISNLEKSA